MTEFVASNGTIVRSNKNGVYVTTADLDSVRIYPNAAQALREFFLAERDAELGRWRSKEHPGIYVQPFDHTTDVVAVLKEEGGLAYGQYSRSDVLNGPSLDPMRTAAREFFAAHPEPKPWHDAKPGEVWAVTMHGKETALLVDPTQFTDGDAGWDLDAEVITGAHRIWPEA